MYLFFGQLWLVLGVKLMEINSNLFSRSLFLLRNLLPKQLSHSIPIPMKSHSNHGKRVDRLQPRMPQPLLQKHRATRSPRKSVQQTLETPCTSTGSRRSVQVWKHPAFNQKQINRTPPRATRESVLLARRFLTRFRFLEISRRPHEICANIFL